MVSPPRSRLSYITHGTRIEWIWGQYKNFKFPYSHCENIVFILIISLYKWKCSLLKSSNNLWTRCIKEKNFRLDQDRLTLSVLEYYVLVCDPLNLQARRKIQASTFVSCMVLYFQAGWASVQANFHGMLEPHFTWLCLLITNYRSY